MAKLRDEITRTISRLSGLGESRPAPTDDGTDDPRVGTQVGAYRILRRLGAGGMGRVYLALDTRLGRHVAIKFISPELASDQIGLLRLVQEARAASALNHPNILTIYDVGLVEGEPFIVSEFVEGNTLRSALEREAITPESAIDIACQIASALNAAHAAGIIHRDLKPTNVMLRPDGYLKLIDFGLAKQVPVYSAETQVGAAELTRPGTTLGTIEYMSPEQARGEEVDCRTDIWSLGIIFYEMLAGRRPFEGKSQSHVLVAVQDQPLPALRNSSAPQGVHGILARALAKQPQDRYVSAGDMLADLEALPVMPNRGRRSFAPPRRQSPFSKIYLPIAALLTVLAVALSWVWWHSRQPHWLQLAAVRQLTYNGHVEVSALSPDGRYLAYVIGQSNGQQALYLKQVASSEEQQKVAPRPVRYWGLTFSPDSQTLYAVEKDSSNVGRLYAIPLFGEHPSVPVLIHVDGPVSFSPSGDEMVYVDNQRADQKQNLVIASRDGQHTRRLLSLTNIAMLIRPTWSPDGQRIAVMLYREKAHSAGDAILECVKPNGSVASKFIMPRWDRIGALRWSPDSKSILTDVGTLEDPDHPQLHQVSAQTGEDRMLTTDLASYGGVSLSSDGSEIVALKTDTKASIWISDGSDLSRGQAIPGFAQPTPTLVWADATHLLADSPANGYPNFALINLQTPATAPFTQELHAEQDAAVIPGTNGKSIVFASNRSGEFHIWRFDSDTNNWRQLTEGSSYELHPDVSPDGRWVVYYTESIQVPRLMRVPSSGGKPTPIGDYAGRNPEVSPDGTWIACSLDHPAGVAIVPFEGTSTPRIMPLVNPLYRWAPDGRSLTTVRTSSTGVSNAWNVPIDGGPPIQLTRFDDLSILQLAWSPSGDRLACIRAHRGADLVLFKNIAR